MDRDELTELRESVVELHEWRELSDCWFGDDERPGTCANWSNCPPDCPLARLRKLAGYMPPDASDCESGDLGEPVDLNPKEQTDGDE